MEKQIKIEKPTTNQTIFDTFDWKFQTFNDPTLEGMLEYAKEFITKIRKKEYYSLCYSGPTETGKTFLLERAAVLLNKLDIRYRYCDETVYPAVIFDSWKTIMRRMLNHQEFGIRYIEKLERCGVLIVSEFVSHDTSNPNLTGVMLDLAHELLDLRAHKPIMIDTNKSLPELETLDIRIASRLKRNDGVFANISKNTPIFSKRKK